MQNKRFSSLSIAGIVLSVIVIGLAIANGNALLALWRAKNADSSLVDESLTSEDANLDRVTALGRLEPEGESIEIAAPNANPRLKQWLVQEGQPVQAGQAIAVMYGLNRSEATLGNLRAKAKVAQARLEQVEAGEKQGRIEAQRRKILELKAQLTGDISVQKATIARHQAELEQEKAQVDGDVNVQKTVVARRQAELDKEKTRVAGEIDIQKTNVARRQAELEKAKVDYQRFQDSYETGIVSTSDLEEKRLQQEIAQEQLKEAKFQLSRTLAQRSQEEAAAAEQLQQAKFELNRTIASGAEQQIALEEQLQEAQLALDRIIATGQQRIREAEATLSSLTDVQAVDVKVAAAELDESLSAIQEAKVDRDDLYVRSPVNGQILSLNTQAGEITGERGLATLGQTQQMYVVAEVYESDIRYVKPGQKATIISEYGGFDGELQGEVESISLQIEKPGVVNNDPAAEADVRIVKVKIKLDREDSDRVKNLNQLQVRVSIDVA